MLGSEVTDDWWDDAMIKKQFEIACSTDANFRSHFGLDKVTLWFDADHSCMLTASSSTFKCSDVDPNFFKAMLFKYREWEQGVDKQLNGADAIQKKLFGPGLLPQSSIIITLSPKSLIILLSQVSYAPNVTPVSFTEVELQMRFDRS